MNRSNSILGSVSQSIKLLAVEAMEETRELSIPILILSLHQQSAYAEVGH